MSFRGMLVQDATLIRAGTLVDRYGDTIADWNNPTETPCKAWIIHRVTKEEHGQGRNAQLSEWLCYLGPEVTPSGKDRLECIGYVFNFNGHPQPCYRPEGGVPELHHWECDLDVTSG